MKVIVIGAGTSGLAAVHTLHKKGADVTCLEANGNAGGRVISKRKRGYILDAGAQFMFKYYDTYFDLCNEMGLGDDIVSFPFRAAIPDLKNGNNLTSILASINPRDLLKVARDLVGFRGVPMKAILQLLPILPTLMSRNRNLRFINFEDMLDLDNESLAEFTVRKGGVEALEHVIQPVAACMTLGEPEDLGAGYGLGLFWYMINGLWTMKHGIGSLSEKLYEKHRECINLNSPVKKIVVEKGVVKGVETDRGFMEADRVICTTTATTALKLIPGLPDTISGPLKMAKYSASCHVIFALEKQLLDDGCYAVALPRRSGSTMAGFADSKIKSPHYAPEGAGLVNCFTFGKHAFRLNEMSDRDVTKVLIQDVQNFVPSMPDEPLFTEIYRYNEAVCTAGPGMLSAISNMKKNHYNDVKGLCLAGEYMYMPSVNGATRSGIDAAEMALK